MDVRVAALRLIGVLALAGCAGSGHAAGRGLGHVTVSAHRGGAGQWPQNSLLAFRNALAAGYDEIEGDTWITADGQPVIYHDDTISRLRCPGALAGRPIPSLTAAQVATVRCDGQPIPTEQQLMTLVAHSANTRTVLRLETKAYAGQSDAQARDWAAHVGRVVVAAGLAGRAIMQDFDWAGIAGYHEVDPSLRVSALIDEPTAARARAAARLGAYDLSYEAKYSTPQLNRLLVSLHLVPTVWDVDPVPADRPSAPSRAQAARIRAAFVRAARSGARVVITNDPALDTRARAGLLG